MRRRVLDEMKTATKQLIELAERLNPTGEIGDGMVARLRELAARARAETACPRCAARDDLLDRFESECG